MHLTPRETERLVLFTAAELSRKRRARGLTLKHPEARAFVADATVKEPGDVTSASQAPPQAATFDKHHSTLQFVPGVGK